MSRYIVGMCLQIQDTINLFDPVSISIAHQRALMIEKQTRCTSNFSLTGVTASRGTSGSGTIRIGICANRAGGGVKKGAWDVGPSNKGASSSGLRCFGCSEMGHK